MIIVTGTKRSGTSMWMQILIAAGIPHFGDAFPKDWGTTLKDANKEGFYESLLRAGIYHATNPHPRTGSYFFPEQVEGHCVKVFIPGLVRSDRAFIGKVIASMREWREYEASVLRLYAMEDAEREKGQHGDRAPPERMPPGLLRDPERVIRDTLAWLGRGDAKAALATPKPQHRHFQRPPSDSVEPAVAEVFDELYAAIDQRRELSNALLRKLNETNERLLPLLEENSRRVMADLQRRRAARVQVEPAP
jgi:hypothetical protein